MMMGHIVITVITGLQDETADLSNKLELLRKVRSCGKCKQLKAQVAALEALVNRKVRSCGKCKKLEAQVAALEALLNKRSV